MTLFHIANCSDKAKWMKSWCTETCLLRIVCDLANADYLSFLSIFLFGQHFITRSEHLMDGCKIPAFSAD
jgi:hypothetical protein